MVYGILFSSSSTCQYPLFKSKLVNITAPFKESKESSIRGNVRFILEFSLIFGSTFQTSCPCTFECDVFHLEPCFTFECLCCTSKPITILWDPRHLSNPLILVVYLCTPKELLTPFPDVDFLYCPLCTPHWVPVSQLSLLYQAGVHNKFKTD